MADAGLTLAAQLLVAVGKVTLRLKDLKHEDLVIAIELKPIITELERICNDKARVSQPQVHNTLAVLEKDIREIEALLAKKVFWKAAHVSRLLEVRSVIVRIQGDIQSFRATFDQFEISLLVQKVNALSDRNLKIPKYTGTKTAARGIGGATIGALVGSVLGPPGIFVGSAVGEMVGSLSTHKQITVREVLKSDLRNMRDELDKYDPINPNIMELRKKVTDMELHFVNG